MEIDLWAVLVAVGAIIIFIALFLGITSGPHDDTDGLIGCVGVIVGILFLVVLGVCYLLAHPTNIPHFYFS